MRADKEYRKELEEVEGQKSRTFQHVDRRRTPKEMRTKKPVRQENNKKKEMVTHSIFLTWRILWMEEPGGLLSMGSQESDTT